MRFWCSTLRRLPPPLALLGSDETVGDLLKANLSLSDIQNKLKGVVIFEIHGLTVDIQKDCGCQPSQALVAINQRMVRHDRMQEGSRFELESRVSVLSESTRLRPGNSRIQET